MSVSTSPSAANATLRGGFLAAIFLMATSAIGPGFITQTATFTATLGAAFAFAILLSILIDFAVQMNVWRLITVTGERAGDLANAAIPYSGHVLTVLIVIGGLVFNIGNIAGAHSPRGAATKPAVPFMARQSSAALCTAGTVVVLSV